MITDKYMKQGVFTEYNRPNPTTIVKKSKQFKQVNFLRDVRPYQEGDEAVNLGF